MDAYGADASILKGWQRLRQKLAAGEVRGYGRDLMNGLDADVALIPAENWNSLSICSANGEDGLVMRYSKTARYISIEIEYAGLLAAFGDKEPIARLPTPAALSRPEEAPELMARVPKRESPERAALSAYIDAEHSGVWPLMSDAQLVDKAHKWVRATDERRAEFPVMKMSKSVAIRHPRRPARLK